MACWQLPVRTPRSWAGSSPALSRQQVERCSSSVSAASFVLPSGTIGLIRRRPEITHGIAAGDVRSDGALIWTRSSRPAHMLVEVAATEDFRNAKQFRSPAPLTPGTDWTGRLRVIGLEPDQQIHYRVTLEDVDTAVRSASQTGTFRTAPLPSSASAPRSIRLHWSGDVAGQGWGINDAFDGYVGFAAMADRNPDLFIHSGDTCYADGSLKETVTLSDGTVWRNRVTPSEVEGCRNARRVPGPVRLQPHGRQLPAVQLSGSPARAVGRPRNGQQLVPGRNSRR